MTAMRLHRYADKTVLPEGSRRLAYLESTGTQWIDTGVVPDSLGLSVEITLLSKGGHVFGSCSSSAAGNMGSWSAYSGKTAGYYAVRKDWVGVFESIAISASSPNTIKFESTTNASSIIYNGQTYTGGVKTVYSYPMVLFGVSTAGVVSTGKMVIYACKIWKNDVLVRDFIPVAIGNTGYMYDTIVERLYPNVGSGDFVLGELGGAA